MKAIVQDRYGSADVLELREVDMPAVGPDDVLVRVRAAGLDPGVWHLMTGLPYLVRVMGFGLRRPKVRVRGSDLAGTVEAVGANVTGFRAGDEVFGSGDGSLAEYVCARQDRLAARPAGLTFEQAAAVPVSGCTALKGLRDVGRLRAGGRVLIIGAGGGVGTFAVQLAKGFGADVTGACSTTKMELVRSLGADRVVDSTRAEFLDGRERYDLVLDTAGNRPLARLRRALAPGGSLVIVGGEGGGRWTGGFGRQTVRAPLLSLLTRQRMRPVLATVRSDDLDELRGRIEAGAVAPVLDRTFPLAEAAEAMRYLHEGRPLGKVVVVTSGAPAPDG